MLLNSRSVLPDSGRVVQHSGRVLRDPKCTSMKQTTSVRLRGPAHRSTNRCRSPFSRGKPNTCHRYRLRFITVSKQVIHACTAHTYQEAPILFATATYEGLVPRNLPVSSPRVPILTGPLAEQLLSSRLRLHWRQGHPLRQMTNLAIWNRLIRSFAVCGTLF
jgi:hypothetical protein